MSAQRFTWIFHAMANSGAQPKLQTHISSAIECRLRYCLYIIQSVGRSCTKYFLALTSPPEFRHLCFFLVESILTRAWTTFDKADRRDGIKSRSNRKCRGRANWRPSRSFSPAENAGRAGIYYPRPAGEGLLTI